MGNIDITPIIEAIIALVSIIVTTVLIPFIKTKMTANQFSYLEGIVKTAVYAAEVLFDGDGRGAEKREYVENYVKKICEQHKMTFDATAVRQMASVSGYEYKWDIYDQATHIQKDKYGNATKMWHTYKKRKPKGYIIKCKQLRTACL